MRLGFILLLLCTSILAKPEIIRIDGATFRPLLIAVPDFKGSIELTRLVRRQLELSGVFRVTEWTKTGEEGLVTGKVKTKNGEMRVDIDISKTTFTYTDKTVDMPSLSHKIADDIYRYFTGEPGIFSSKIVAARRTTNGKQIVLMDFDGSNPRQLTHASSVNMVPVIGPRSKEVYFTTYLNKNPDLYAISIEGKNLRPVSTKRGLNVGPSISPDGHRIALTLSKDGDSEIYTMDLDGKNLTRLTYSPGVDTSPSWSPDGKKIAFISARSGNPQVYLMNADGTSPLRLTFQGKYNQTPRFSPQGDVIVFMGRDEKNVFDIFTYDLTSKKIARVTQGQGSNEDPSFSPNGRMIIFTSTRDGGRDLYMSSIDGTFQKRITSDGPYWTPNWGPAT